MDDLVSKAGEVEIEYRKRVLPNVLKAILRLHERGANVPFIVKWLDNNGIHISESTVYRKLAELKKQVSPSSIQPLPTPAATFSEMPSPLAPQNPPEEAQSFCADPDARFKILPRRLREKGG